MSGYMISRYLVPTCYRIFAQDLLGGYPAVRFHESLEKTTWLGDSRHLVFQTWATGRAAVYLLDMQAASSDKKLQRLDPAVAKGGSVSLLATCSDAMIVTTSSLTRPPEIWAGMLLLDNGTAPHWARVASLGASLSLFANCNPTKETHKKLRMRT